jgi:hypothetical protein
LVWEDGENRKINLFKAKVVYLNDTFGEKFQSRILSQSEPLNIMTFNIRFANDKDKFQWYVGRLFELLLSDLHLGLAAKQKWLISWSVAGHT